eukprot:m.14619 g.14619  ORF g.14619 m.14619 type:complete len:60 (-) comp4853_c0_seq1:152-331(-)
MTFETSRDDDTLDIGRRHGRHDTDDATDDDTDTDTDADDDSFCNTTVWPASNQLLFALT